jgi:glycosyltransferase involved in cell wall biosynthesis
MEIKAMANTAGNKKKILIVAYAFPPIPYGGTYRCLRLCRGLEKYQINCHVLTINQYPDIPNDFGLLKKVPKNTTIYRTPIIDPWRRYQNIRKKFTNGTIFRYLNKIISFALRFITFPDHMLFWVPFGFLKALKIIRTEGIDAVLVSSPPNSSQLIGLLLKKTKKIKWIADFRDPIFGNVAEVNLINPADIISKVERFFLKKYETLIVRNSDYIVANTKTHRQELKQDYNLENIVTIRNCFDPADFQDTVTRSFDKFTIAHIGSIYGKRNVDVLFDATQKLITEFGKDKPDLQVIFVGQNDKSLIEKVKSYGLEQYVHIQPQIPHKDAISLMKSSNLLLLVKATGEWSLGQIPGKFFEYVGAKKRILCIAPIESEVASLIIESSMGYVVEKDSAKIKDILKKEYALFKSVNRTNTDLPEKIASQYSMDHMARKILELIF